MKTVYQIRSEVHTDAHIEGYSSVMQKLLLERGITNSQEALRFCKPNYTDLSSPSLLHDIDKALDRIVRALKENEKITIYGDYDADGVPASAIMYETFKQIGYANFDVYIPHRHDEGFGLHILALDTIAATGTTLVITVDLGTSAVVEIAHARALGMDVIVTDHHLPAEILPPDAIAVVNPKLGNYPDPMLCASAVAYQLVRALLVRLTTEPVEGLVVPVAGWEKWLLDLVGIATISDMVPLIHENRIFATYGLRVLRKTRRPGLCALIQKLGLAPNYINEDDVGFSITPRINAASRMDHPMRAFELLTADNVLQAETLALHLMKKNDERKKSVATAMRTIHKKIEMRPVRSVLVIGDGEWGHGIIGLIAGKVTEEYKVSTFVWTEHHDGTLKGSCRGHGDVDVTTLMSQIAPETFVQYGGHAGAGGFTITRDQIHFLEDRLVEQLASIQKNNTGEEEKVTTYIDAVVSVSDINKQLYTDMQQLAPFGMDNPRPVFAVRGTCVAMKLFGKGDVHTEITLRNGEGKAVRALAWYASLADFSYNPAGGEEVCVIGSLEESRFMGKVELRLKLIDVVRDVV